MNIFLKKSFFIFITLFLTSVHAQLDSKHYLPPLKQASNYQAFNEQRIYLSTPEISPFDVNIYVGTSTVPIVITGLANGAPKTYNPGKGDNNKTLVTRANTGIVIKNSGLRFESSGGEKFYVNWRGRSGAQAGSLTCKGTKALGRDFRWGGIPNIAKTQNTLNSSLGIMATENGTTVVIDGYDPNCVFRNGAAVGGHTQDQFTINLEKGETFVLEAYRDAAPTANDDGWLGARITSNNPIATSMGGMNVGIKPTSSTRDVGIDQAVPTNVLGRDYVFIRANGNDESEFPIIVATQNNTEIKVNGIVVSVINDGEYYKIPGSNYSSQNAGASMFVETSKAAYAFQCLTGKSKAIQTIGMNFIAPINCLLPSSLSEISEIDFIETKKFTNGLTIIASTTTPDTAFTVTENGTSIGVITSTPVAGTSEWKSFYIAGLEGRVSVTSSGGGFAAGVFMTDNQNAGVAGYFSGFDTSPVVGLDTSKGGCFPGAALKEITGGFDAYQWYYNGTILPGEVGSTLIPKGIGDYFVEVTKAGCTYSSAVFSIYNCDPDINVVKTANKNTIEEGDNVEFTVTVKSLGIFPVTNLKIEDALPSPLSLVSATPTRGTFSGTTWDIGTMTSGEVQSIKIVATALVGTEGASVVNTVSNTQTEIDSNRTPDDFVEPVKITDAEIQLIKEATLNDGGDGIVNVGDLVTYTFKVTNHGEVPLKTIVLTDPFLGGTITATPTGDNGNNQLDLTEEWVYVVNYSIKQTDIDLGRITNTATVTGVQPNGKIQSDVSDDPKNTADVDTEGDGDPDDPTLIKIALTPVLNLVKKATLNDGGDGLQIGDKIDYTLTLTNTGNTAYLENVVVNDPLLGGNLTGPTSGDNGDSRLDLSETWVYEISYTLTKADLDLGQVTNSATVFAEAPGGTSSASDVSDDPDNPLNVDSNFNGNPDDPTVFSLPKSDLQLLINPDVKKACVGGTVVFTVQLSNKSLNSDTTATDASNIVVEEILPVGYTYVSHTTSTGIYVPGTGSWTVNNLAKEATTTLTITTTVNTPTSTTDEYVNKTEIIAADQYDPNSNVLVSTSIDDFMDGVIDNDESMVKLIVTEIPVIALGTVTQISTCGVENGSILLTGLFSGETYVLRYKKDSNQTNTSLVADGTGNILISSLPEGSYSDFEVELNGCTSNLLAGSIVISEPATPTLTLSTNTDPTTCLGADGTIVIATTDLADATYVVNYLDAAASSQTTNMVVVGNVGTISGLSSGTYNDITVSNAGCISVADIDVTLTDPATPTLTLSTNTDPTTCLGADGTIVIATTDLADATYVVNYVDAAASSQTTNMVVVGNVGTISGLSSGTYNDITVSNAGCTSVADIDVTLTDPATPTLTLSTNTDPTTCLGADGTIVIATTDLADATYVVNYVDAAASSQTTNMVVVGNVGTISGLSSGTYNDITVSNAGCTSVADIDVTLTDPATPTLTLSTNTDPTTCLGADGTIVIATTDLADATYVVNYVDAAASTQTTNMVVVGNVGTISGLSSGTYNDITVTNAGCTSVADIDVTLTDPATPTLVLRTITQITACGSTDASIEFTGLVSKTVYTLSYQKDGGLVNTEITSNELGDIGIFNLPEGLYTNFTVELNNCSSNIISRPIVISEPATALIALADTENPSTCNGKDGVIEISGLEDFTIYTIDYITNGINVNTTLESDSDGRIKIENLVSGNYTDIKVTLNNCESNTLAGVSLSDPSTPTIVLDKVIDPITCDGKGSIDLIGLGNSITYEVNYLYNSLAESKNISSDALGRLSIETLGAGTYENISVTIAGCMSNTISYAIINPPVISLGSVIQPTICGGTGSYELTGLVANETYDISHVFNGETPVLNTVTANSLGIITVVGVVTGVYTDIKAITSTGCISNSVAEVIIVDPITSLITLGSVINPSSCTVANGSIQINGLLSSTAYEISYNLDGGSLVSINKTSDTMGSMTLINLAVGDYTNVNVKNINTRCVSNSLSFTLNLPELPLIPTVVNQDFCGDTTIGQLEGRVASGEVLIWYDVISGGTPLTVTDILTTKSYYAAAKNNSSECESLREQVDVVVHEVPIITTKITNNPTTCGGTNGSIELAGLKATTLYEVSYKKDEVNVLSNLTSDASGLITIPNLSSGNYTEIITTLNSCNSLPTTAILSDPIAPVLALGNLSQLSACGIKDGRITLNGLLGTTTYTINYLKDGSQVSGLKSTNSEGELILSDLPAGTYSDFKVVLDKCSSNTITTVVKLEEPAVAIIGLLSSKNPTVCNGNDGAFLIDGLEINLEYTVDYLVNGTLVTTNLTSSTSGVITVNNLVAGNYTTIKVTKNNCESNILSGVSLNDPMTPTIVLDKVIHPSECSGTGSIELTGLASNTTYTTNFTHNGVADSSILTSDASGNLIMSVLGAGTYENISVTLAGCTSNTITYAVINPPVISLGSVKPPVICGGTGSFEIEGLVIGESYMVSHQFNGSIATLTSLIANELGTIVVDGLVSGTYSNIKTITGTGCESNSISEVIFSDPIVPVLALGTVTNLTSCTVADGSIVLTGLTENTNYNLSYEYNTVLINTNVATNASGEIVISNLSEGNYNAIKVKDVVTKCESNILETTLMLPTLPSTPMANSQTFCGTRQLFHLEATVSINESLIWYDVLTGGEPLTSTTDLETKTYYAVAKSNLTNCESSRKAIEVIINPCADISMQKTTSTIRPNVGDEIEFSLRFTNNGPDTSIGVGVEDILPVGFTFISATHGGVLTGSTIYWNNLTIPASGLIITYKVKVNKPTNTVDEYKNTAQIIASTTADPNSMPNNDDGDQSEDDESSLTVVPQSINLELTIDVDDTSVNVNQELIYTVTVKNIGVDTATNVGFESIIPNGLVYVLNSVSGGGVLSGNTIMWDNITISPSNQVVVTFRVLVKEPTAGGLNYETTAEVVKADQFDVNSTPKNDDGDQSEDDESKVVPVVETVNLSIVKTMDKEKFGVGDIVTFSLKVSNSGPAIATNILVVDQLPVGYTYQSHLGGTYNSDSGLWTIPSLNNGADTTLIINAIVNTSTNTLDEYKNTVAITGLDQYDTDDSNNGNFVIGELSEIDLRITKKVNKQEVIVDELVEFKITLILEGTVPATNVEVSEKLPSGYSYVSSVSNLGSYNASSGKWILDVIPSPSIQVLTITAKTLPNGDYENVAFILDSDQQNVNISTEAKASVNVKCLSVFNEFTPNNDGDNEFLIIDCIENYPNNTLEIFNRWGNVVYKKDGYDNTFNGESNGRATILVKEQLPVGTYYYVLNLGDGSEPKTGWIYIKR